jgi:hypothetical protein
LHRLSDAKAVTHTGQDCTQRPRPASALDPNLIRTNLPRSTNRSIDQGLLSPSKGGPLGGCDELLGLRRKKRQRDWTDAVHLQLWRKEFDCAGGEELAWATHCGQDCSQFAREGGH